MPLRKDSEILSQFRQISFQKSPAVERLSKGLPVRADEFAKNILARLRAALGGAKESIAKNWGTVAPAGFLNKCEPETIRGGILYLRVPDATVRQELAMREREMLEKIQKLDGCKNIKKIRFA